MTMLGSLPKRYARALLSLAIEQNQVAKVSQDLAALADAWHKSRELREIFANPTNSAKLRHEIVKAIVARVGASALLDNTLRLLSDRNRMRYLPQIAEAFSVLAEEREGRVRAEVFSAAALPDSYFTRLQSALETATGKKVHIVKHIDPSLIAGVVTRVGDRVFDGSIKNRLDDIKHQLLENA